MVKDRKKPDKPFGLMFTRGQKAITPA